MFEDEEYEDEFEDEEYEEESEDEDEDEDEAYYYECDNSDAEYDWEQYLKMLKEEDKN